MVRANSVTSSRLPRGTIPVFSTDERQPFSSPIGVLWNSVETPWYTTLTLFTTVYRTSCWHLAYQRNCFRNISINFVTRGRSLYLRDKSTTLDLTKSKPKKEKQKGTIIKVSAHGGTIRPSVKTSNSTTVSNTATAESITTTAMSSTATSESFTATAYFNIAATVSIMTTTVSATTATVSTMATMASTMAITCMYECDCML